MNVEYIVEWMRKQGQKVFHTDSSYWHMVGPRILQAFPCYWQISPTEDEINRLMKENGILALRYSTPFVRDTGKVSYHVVCDKEEYPLQPLAKKARHDVQHCSDCASCIPISIDQLTYEGWILRSETLVRQGRVGAESKSFWVNLCQAAEGNPAFEAWGIIYDGKLVASLLACTVKDTVIILYQQSRTAYLKIGINNTLAYTFTQEVLKRSDVNRVFYGLESLDAPPSVDKFKFRMGYSALPVRQKVVFAPILQPFINSTIHQILTYFLRIKPGSYFLAKAEGMIRFYLNGKSSLSEQEWPKVLLPQKNPLIHSEMP